MSALITDRAMGRWPSILTQLGVDRKLLNRKNQPCPWCGGKDRFRFIDKGGSGGFICNQCGGGNTGVEFVMRMKGVDFLGAKALIEGVIGSSRVEVPRARSDVEAVKARMLAAWREARMLTGSDLSSRYLRRRGIVLDRWPFYLRHHGALRYRVDANTIGETPGMLAKFVAADGQSATMQKLLLREPGLKAEVDKPRLLFPVEVPLGGAVRLADAAPEMGVAEGIETALSAAQLHRMPVWACLTANYLMKWKPPPEAKRIVIFGDRDANFKGQSAAYVLANRLVEQLKLEARVMLPPPPHKDWNDVVMATMNTIDAVMEAMAPAA